MTSQLRRFGPLVIAFLVCAGALQRSDAGRVVAIGDVHGELETFASILRVAGLVDEGRRWIGGNATLVQLGDLVDRGPKSREVLDFIMTLQQEASRRGGSVRVSLGNHEVMNIMGDMRYVVAADYAAFTDRQSEQRRKNAFRDYSRLQTRKGLTASEVDWMKAHPLGFVEQREGFGPQGKYGKWLRTLSAINKVGDSLFLHGGINPALLPSPTPASVEQLNTGIRTEIQAFDKVTQYMIAAEVALPFFTMEEFAEAADAELTRLKKSADVQAPEVRGPIQLLEAFLQAGNWLGVHDEGPLWFRGYDRWSDAEGESRIVGLLQGLGVRRIVVGHTLQPSGEIRQRFGGRIFLIETVMSRGRPSALDISAGRVQAIYLDRRVDLN